MKLELDVPTMRFLNWILRDPAGLPTQLLGNRQFEHYQTKDTTGARQLIALQKWINDKVLDGKEQVGMGWTKKASLKKVYVDRVLEIMEHYKAFGNLAVTAEPYWKLKDMLEGKSYEVDEDVEDVEEDDVQEEDEVAKEAVVAASEEK